MSRSTVIIPFLRYDDHFMPVTSYEEISQKKLTMTKSNFKKFIAHEKKKEEFNGKLFEYSKEHHKNRLALKEPYDRYMSDLNMLKTLQETKIDGNFKTVEGLVHDTRKSINDCIKLSIKNKSEYDKLQQNFKIKYEQFLRLSSISHIENKVYLHNINSQTREKEEKQEQKSFLNLLGKLPDEVLRVIQTYFTFETRAAILVKTYNPIRMFCALNNSGLKKVIGHINKKYAPVNKDFSRALKVDPELHNKMITLYHYFHNWRKGEYILSTPNLKLYLQYIFLLFHEYKQHKWCFDLYRAIIVCKK